MFVVRQLQLPLIADPKPKKYGFKRCTPCRVVFPALDTLTLCLKCFGEELSPSSCRNFTEQARDKRQNSIQSLLLQEASSVISSRSEISEAPDKMDKRPESAPVPYSFRKPSSLNYQHLALKDWYSLINPTDLIPTRVQAHDGNTSGQLPICD